MVSPPDTPESHEAALARLRARVAARSGLPEEAVSGVISPYRVCPIGAHVDHQYGPVLGMAIDVGTTLAFVPAYAPGHRLRTRDPPAAGRR